jgi:hypothetical protein
LRADRSWTRQRVGAVVGDQAPERQADGSGEQTRAERRTVALLAIGAVAGLIAAASAIVAPASYPRGVPPDAVAMVNDVVIRRDDYLRLLAGFESDARGEVDATDRQHVLDRMIDEELLVQRALDLGLARIDRRVRADLTSALITSIVGIGDDREPEPGELEAFYADESRFFARPGRLHVRQVFFRVPTDADEGAILARATLARDALRAGRSLESVRDEFGDDEVSPVPDTLLPAVKLREYVGPTAVRAALELEAGETSEPVRSGIGIHVLVMADRTPTVTPPLAEIEPQVQSEWRRRQGDRALRAYLDQLRDDGDVEVLVEFGN